MRIIIIVILLDVFIFALGSVYAEKEHTVYDNKDRNYHMDRYGYYWQVHD